MSILDDVLWLLKDGKWHNVKKIAAKTNQSTIKMEMAIKFLYEYDFIYLNKNFERAKLQPSTQRFIKELALAEKEEN